MIDRACAGLGDPAAVFAVSVRITGRLGWTHPDLARFLVGAGFDLLDQPAGLAPRALRDIKAGQAAGRFSIPHAEVALGAVAGGLLGLLRTHLLRPDEIGETAVDELARALLPLLGIADEEAARLVAPDLPPSQAW
jgi:hypothetical protein